MGRIVGIASLLLFVVSSLVAGDVRDQFARETGLDIDLIGLVQVDVRGTELTVVFVYINERAFESKISPRLRRLLWPYLGRNALYVNPSVKTIVSQFEFDPLAISAQLDGGQAFTPGPPAWVEITPGFLEGRFEVNPTGADQGSGSEGILVLGEGIGEGRPFDLIYAGEHARFVIAPSRTTPESAPAGQPTAASPSHVPVLVPPLEDVSTLEDVLGQDVFSAEAMAVFLGLDSNLVHAIDLELRGEALRLLFIRLGEEVRESALTEDLLETLDPLVGTGAVMVWAFSATGAAFSPWNFWIQQAATNFVFFSSASFVELTAGFLQVEWVEPGAVVAGVVRLPKGVDTESPFVVFYRSTPVAFP